MSSPSPASLHARLLRAAKTQAPQLWAWMQEQDDQRVPGVIARGMAREPEIPPSVRESITAAVGLLQRLEKRSHQHSWWRGDSEFPYKEAIEAVEKIQAFLRLAPSHGIDGAAFLASLGGLPRSVRIVPGPDDGHLIPAKSAKVAARWTWLAREVLDGGVREEGTAVTLETFLPRLRQIAALAAAVPKAKNRNAAEYAVSDATNALVEVLQRTGLARSREDAEALVERMAADNGIVLSPAAWLAPERAPAWPAPGDTVHFLLGVDPRKDPMVTGTVLQRYTQGEPNEWIVGYGKGKEAAVRSDQMKRGPAPSAAEKVVALRAPGGCEERTGGVCEVQARPARAAQRAEDAALAEHAHRAATAYDRSLAFSAGDYKARNLRSIALRLASGKANEGDRREARRAIEELEAAGPPSQSNPRRRRNPDGGVPSALHHPETIPTEVIFDSEGRKYAAVYRVVATALDGSGPVLTSHDPVNMDWVKGYPPEFQTRDLGSPEESAKINTISRHLDPIRLLGKNMDPTLGPPVAWQDGDRYYVLGGNGRTIAFLRSSDTAYATYLKEARRRWNCFPDGDAPDGYRWMLIRSIAGLSKGEAVQLAAASQLSTAADESRIGKALGLVRSLSLDVDNLPPISWTEPVAADNMGEFADRNSAFVQAVLRGMDPAKRARYQGDMDALANVIAAVFVGFLPPAVRKPGMFEDPKVEDALLGAIPGLVTTAGLVRTGEVYPEYDLLAALSEAVDVFATMRRLRLSYARFQSHLEAEMRTQPVPGVRRLSDAPPVALALAAALFRSARAAAPEITVSTTIREYIDAILNNAQAPGGSPSRPALFGGAPRPGDERRPEPGELLASFVPGFRLPSAPPAQSLFGARNNPRTNPPSTIIIRLLREAKKIGYTHGEAPPFAWWQPLTEASLDAFKRINPAFYWHVVQGSRRDRLEVPEAVLVLHAAMIEQLPTSVRYLAERAPAIVQSNVVTLLPAVLTGHYDARAAKSRRDPLRELEEALSGRLGAWGRSATEAMEAILPAARSAGADARQARMFGNPRRPKR